MNKKMMKLLLPLLAFALIATACDTADEHGGYRRGY